jgi:tetratricopeptide (TPR) repeat protein
VAHVYYALAKVHAAGHPDDRDRFAELADQAARWNSRAYFFAKTAGAAWLESGNYARSLPFLELGATLADSDPTVSAEERAWVRRTRDETRPNAELGWGAFRRGEEAIRHPGGHVDALEFFRQAVREKPDLIDAYFEIVKIERYKGNLRGALDALEAARKALDAANSPADDVRRTRITALQSLYEAEQAAPEDPVVVQLEAAKFARMKHDLRLAIDDLDAARKLLDDAKAPADDPRRVELEALAKVYAKERDAGK